MKIEQVNKQNYGEVFTLQRAAFVNEARLYGTPDIPSLNEEFNNFCVRMSESDSWAAIDGNRIVGAVSLRIYRGAPDVERLMVAPDRRGEGIATLLLSALENAALESGHSTIQLILGDAATDNRQIYTHLGWLHANTCQLPGNPSVILHTMKKKLIGPV